MSSRVLPAAVTRVPWIDPSQESFTYKLSWVYVFLVFSRLTEIILLTIRLNFRVVLVVGSLALLINVANGGVFRSLYSRCGLFLTAFSGWLVLCVPFSAWPGGSVAVIREKWLIAYLTFFIAASVMTIAQFRKLFYGLVLSEVLLIFAVQVLGTEKHGRFALAAGTFGNPNDLAIHLLLGFPFLYFFLMPGRTRSVFLRLLFLGCSGLLIVTILKTGSRTGLILLCVLGVIVFWRLSAAAKAAAAAASVVVVLVGISVARETALDRFRTLFGGDDEVVTGAMLEAAESRQTRIQMLRESIKLTIANPVFGVGPGMFQVVTGGHLQQVTGAGGGWRETHNTYTQISSETGIPGLILYAAAMVWCFRRLRAIRRAATPHPHLKEIGDLAYCMYLSLLVFALSAPFGSLAYNLYFPLLAGLITAFDFAAAKALPVAVSPTFAPRSWRFQGKLRGAARSKEASKNDVRNRGISRF